MERGGGRGVVEALRERRAVIIVEVRRSEGELGKGRFFGGNASEKSVAGGGGRSGGAFSGLVNGEGDVWRRGIR